ncbi:hypothetical protein [Anaerococcus cruorum]|uniref:Uncharacterized protein n=1 Tax=Anaerococcus cruorum TaxID=3115617 RepID=A0ABW9MW77_9FIRM
MKTKEFIERVEDLGFEAEIYSSGIYVKDSDGDCVTSVGSKCEYMVDCSWTGFMFVGATKRKSLLELAFAYASTPIKGRQEEKKYYLRHRYLNKYTQDNYLNWDLTLLPTHSIFLDDYKEDADTQTQFTKSEIEKLKMDFDVNLDEFDEEKVE